MEIVDSTIINVLNKSDSFCALATNINPIGYAFEPSRDGEPYAIPLTYSEIRVANTQSDVFRNGILWFDVEVQEDVYNKLGIRDWENILSDEQIRSIILKPTTDGLKKLINIKDPAYFERVRGMMVMLKNAGIYDISTRVVEAIIARYQELCNGKKISSIVIASTSQNDEHNVDELVKAKLEEEKEKLKEQLRKELLKELQTEQKKESEIVEEEPKKATKKTKSDK